MIEKLNATYDSKQNKVKGASIMDALRKIDEIVDFCNKVDEVMNQIKQCFEENLDTIDHD